MHKDTFTDPKVGDAICIPSSRWHPPTKRSIIKVTPTRITDDCGLIYRRKDGGECGGGRGRVVPWTAKHDADVEAQRIVNELAKAVEHLARNASIPANRLGDARALTVAIYELCPRKET